MLHIIAYALPGLLVALFFYVRGSLRWGWGWLWEEIRRHCGKAR